MCGFKDKRLKFRVNFAREPHFPISQKCDQRVLIGYKNVISAGGRVHFHSKIVPVGGALLS
ncbi:hypothetical protein SAMN04488498_108186 [Mesorhizobium albiziae]|uniref:Uncharacterized protein n=1 Tax=Neomesorhizobium albiziae TaxID=335020 RepID=A0A1I4ANT5_9HYPH|nr:hypothetical protein SAMN04488498_108186 [Mesorhizobium albiziae]